jgi:hypothetical protein
MASRSPRGFLHLAARAAHIATPFRLPLGQRSEKRLRGGVGTKGAERQFRLTGAVLAPRSHGVR